MKKLDKRIPREIPLDGAFEEARVLSKDVIYTIELSRPNSDGYKFVDKYKVTEDGRVYKWNVYGREPEWIEVEHENSTKS